MKVYTGKLAMVAFPEMDQVPCVAGPSALMAAGGTSDAAVTGAMIGC